MKAQDVLKPSVPIAYGLLTIQLAVERGVKRQSLLAGLDIPPELLETPEARLSMDQYSRLIDRSLRLSNEPALGYEFGLRSNVTAHGLIGLRPECCASRAPRSTTCGFSSRAAMP